MSDLTELRRLAEAATPGPWLVTRQKFVCLVSDVEYYVTTVDAGDRTICDAQTRPNDCAYIAAMHPATTLALLDRLAELEADLMRHKEAIASMAFGEVPDDAATRRLTPFPGKPMVVVMSTPSPSSDDGGSGR